MRDDNEDRYNRFMNRLRLIFCLLVKNTNQQRAYLERTAGVDLDAATEVIEKLVSEFIGRICNTVERKDYVSPDVLELFTTLYENGLHDHGDGCSNSDGRQW